jgi:hypothetical protein
MRITHKIHIVELREQRVSKIVGGGRGQLPEILVEMGRFCEQEVRSHFWLCVSEKTLWVTKHSVFLIHALNLLLINLFVT